MKVIRLEFSNGEGIYHYDESNPKHDLRKLLIAYSATADKLHLHPVPQNDSKLMRDIESKFGKQVAHDKKMLYALFLSCAYGFESAKQLLRWFYDESFLRQLTPHDIRVAYYDVPDSKCLVGNTQVAFQLFYHSPEHLVQVESIEEFLAENQ
jgi:hypothetical protein